MEYVVLRCPDLGSTAGRRDIPAGNRRSDETWRYGSIIIVTVLLCLGCGGNDSRDTTRRALPNSMNTSNDAEVALAHIRAVIAAGDVEEVMRFLTSSEPLVRALVARRLSSITSEVDNAEQRASIAVVAIEALMVDPHPLVRSNALIAAIQTDNANVNIVKAISFDSRSFVDLEELLDFRDSQAAALRQEFAPHWNADQWQQLKAIGLDLLQSVHPEEQSTSLLLPIGMRRRIGAVAAVSLVDTEVSDAIDHIRLVASLTESVGLRNQLQQIQE